MSAPPSPQRACAGTCPAMVAAVPLGQGRSSQAALLPNTGEMCTCSMPSCDLERSEVQNLPGLGVSDKGLRTSVNCTGAATLEGFTTASNVQKPLVLVCGVWCWAQTSMRRCARAGMVWWPVQGGEGSHVCRYAGRRHPGLARIAMPSRSSSSSGPDAPREAPGPGRCNRGYQPPPVTVSHSRLFLNRHLLLHASSKLCPDVLLHRGHGGTRRGRPHRPPPRPLVSLQPALISFRCEHSARTPLLQVFVQMSRDHLLQKLPPHPALLYVSVALANRLYVFLVGFVISCLLHWKEGPLRPLLESLVHCCIPSS